jgi:predicted component of type VI protein secretion system
MSAHRTPTTAKPCPIPLARVIVASEGRTVGELPLHLGRTVVGRTPDNDLQIDNRFVSRHHCQILTSPDGCVIEDLNSTNGIVVKAKRVPPPQPERRRRGDNRHA